jgi:hypothetical protein
VKVLHDHGARTFLDQDHVRPGDKLHNKLSDGIEKSNVLLVIWSRNSVSSQWVPKECKIAKELGKPIIPYLLDSSQIPEYLAELVYITAEDAQQNHAQLLRGVFGSGYNPGPHEVFPGRWRATVWVIDPLGGPDQLMSGSSFDLELRTNGQIVGIGKIDPVGMAGFMMIEAGVAEQFLAMQFPITGNWSYHEQSQILTLKIIVGGFNGGQSPMTIYINTNVREGGALCGKDLTGNQWRLERVS